ncbi:hypothetical protein ABIA39_008947 [Nocardia sp. GAS34]
MEELIADIVTQARHRAFHLETRDEYRSESEQDGLHAFLSGQDPHGDWFSPWQKFVTELTERGVRMQRGRIVTVPPTDYTRYLLALTPHNIAAGEDVRWLPRDRADPTDAITDDFWLMDDAVVGFSLFDTNDWFVGGAVTSDPRIVDLASTIRDRVWATAVPHAQFGT